MTSPFSLRIFVPNGNPDGLRVVEKSNWTGKGIVCPRTLYAEARARPEFERAGVYVLVGPSTEGVLPRVYVGEGDPIGPRLDSHASKKDFWTSLAAFTSKDENLNKAHVQYLEARLVALADEARRCELDNGNRPAPPSLSEADAAEVEGFLAEVLLCLPVLGIGVFEKPRARATTEGLLYLRARGIEARGYETPQGFVVLAGSQAAKDEVRSIHGYLTEMRRTLVEKGILRAEGPHLLLKQDYSFDSPSGASGVLLGRSSNGREEWEDEKGRTLKEIQVEVGETAK